MRQMGITEWATFNRHPAVLKAADVSAENGRNLFISTRYVISKATFCQQIKTHKKV